MIEIQRGKTKVLSLITSDTATAVTVDLKYDWGDTIVTGAATSGSGTFFTYTLTTSDTNCCGVIKVIWKYTISGAQKTKNDYVQIFQPYSTASAFFNDYSELSAFEDNFIVTERRMRQVIDTYCGQNFQFIPAKTLKLDGSGTNIMNTRYRIETITQVLRDGTEDITAYIEKHPESDFHFRRIRDIVGVKDYLPADFTQDWEGNFFRPRRTYHILGDWGWPYAPTNIEEASKILIADYFNQDSDYRKHNVIFAGQGPVQTNFKGDLIGTTGNLDADVLLMDYTKFIMEYI